MSSTLKLAAVLTLIDRASPALRQIERNSRNLQSVLGSTRYALDGLDQPLNPARMQQYANAVDRVEHNFAGATQEIHEMSAALSRAIKLTATLQQQAEKVAGHFSKQRQSMRNDLAKGVMQLGLTGMAGAAFIRPSIDFDKQMSSTQAVLNLEKQSAEYAQLRADAINLGASSSFSASQVAQAQFELAAGGFDAAKVHASIKGSLDLAAAGKVELAQAAEIAIGTLNGFGLATDQIGRMNDVMVETTNRSATSVIDLGETMKYVAPIAKQYGVSLEQAHAMTGLLGNANIKGSEAGTALRAMMARIASPPKAAIEAFASIKVSPVDKNGQLKDLSILFAEIQRKTKSLSNSQRLDIYSSIAGVEAMSAMAVLVDQTAVLDEKTGQTVNKLYEMTQGLQQAGGAAAKVAAIQMDNLAGDLDAAKGAFETLSITVAGEGGVLHGTLREAVQNIAQLINKITAWAKANPELLQTIGSLVLKLLMFKAAMFGIKYSFLLVFGTFFSMLAAFLKFGLILLIINRISSRFGFGLLSRLKLMLHGVLLFGRAFMFLAAQSIPFVIGMLARLSVALFTTPIGWIVLLIAAAALMIYRYWEPIKAFFQGVWIGIKQGVAPLAASFDMLKTALAPLQPIWDGLVQILTVVGGVIGEMITPVQSSADTLNSASSAGQLFGQVLGGIITLIGQVVIGFITAFVTGIQMVGQALGTMVGMVQVYGSQIIEWFSNLGSRAAEIFSMIGQSILNGLTLPVRLAIDAINLLINGINRIPGISIPNIPSIPIAGATGTVAPVKAAGLPPLKAAGAKQTITNHFAGSPITITGVTDPKAVGAEVQRQLVANQRQQESRQRSALTDTE